jgi:hypothetical protein
MKPFPPPPHSQIKRPLPAARTTPRPAPASTQRSTVLQSLLLCPHGGVESHRHGQGARRAQTR